MARAKPGGDPRNRGPANGKMRRAHRTPGPLVERMILQLLRRDDIPRGAYDLMAALRAAGHAVGVMSIYRALGRLRERGAIDRVAALAAYRLSDGRRCLLTVCRDCGRTAAVTAPDLHAAIARIAADRAFIVGAISVEAVGQCPACRESLRRS